MLERNIVNDIKKLFIPLGTFSVNIDQRMEFLVWGFWQFWITILCMDKLGSRYNICLVLYQKATDCSHWQCIKVLPIKKFYRYFDVLFWLWNRKFKLFPDNARYKLIANKYGVKWLFLQNNNKWNWNKGTSLLKNVKNDSRRKISRFVPSIRYNWVINRLIKAVFFCVAPSSSTGTC